MPDDSTKTSTRESEATERPIARSGLVRGGVIAIAGVLAGCSLREGAGSTSDARARQERPVERALGDGVADVPDASANQPADPVAPVARTGPKPRVPYDSLHGTVTPEIANELALAPGVVPLQWNAHATFASAILRPGFTPDPRGFHLSTRAAGVDEVSAMEIVDESTHTRCTRAYVARNPDFHFTVAPSSTFGLLRFYVLTERTDGDLTLLIRLPSAHWRCNDDHRRSGWSNARMPAVDLADAPPGRYDVWVGTLTPSVGTATLYVTAVEANHP